MSSRSNKKTTNLPSLPQEKSEIPNALGDIRSVLGKPLLLEGEDPEAYDRLFLAIDQSVQPADALEEIWVRDLVDATWEVERLRGAKSSLLRANAYKGLEELLKPLVEAGPETMAKLYAKREKNAVKEVKLLLAEAGLDERAIIAQTLAVKIREVEAIDFLITRAEARRIAVTREIERHREVIGRWAGKKPLEAQYKELDN
jgi:hypothetical protein